MGEIKQYLCNGTEHGTRTGFIAVGSMASCMPVGLPYIAVRGRHPGKTLWLHGQVHGDEINGIVAALNFMESLDAETMHGNVVFTPTGNPHALDQRKKRNPYDDLDLDQCYPGNPNGLISERLAHALFAEIDGTADFLVNLHTMNPLFDSRAYAVYKVHPQSRVTEDDVLKAIALFSPNVACRMQVNGTGELPGNIAGALDYQCLLRNIPAFMLELGGGSRYEPENVALAQRGFARLAAYLGILPHLAPQLPTAATVRRVTRRGWMTFAQGGIFVPEVAAGDDVSAGTVLGRTRTLLGQPLESFAVDSKGIVIGLRRDPVAHTGERVAFMAWEWEQLAIPLS